MITHAASRKHYYTVLLDRTLWMSFYFWWDKKVSFRFIFASAAFGVLK